EDRGTVRVGAGVQVNGGGARDVEGTDRRHQSLPPTPGPQVAAPPRRAATRARSAVLPGLVCKADGADVRPDRRAWAISALRVSGRTAVGSKQQNSRVQGAGGGARAGERTVGGAGDLGLVSSGEDRLQ